MNCIFELQEQYLMSERSERVRYCSCNSNIKFISSRHREIFSMIVADPECKLFDKRFYFPHAQDSGNFSQRHEKEKKSHKNCYIKFAPDKKHHCNLL